MVCLFFVGKGGLKPKVSLSNSSKLRTQDSGTQGAELRRRWIPMICLLADRAQVGSGPPGPGRPWAQGSEDQRAIRAMDLMDPMDSNDLLVGTGSLKVPVRLDSIKLRAQSSKRWVPSWRSKILFKHCWRSTRSISIRIVSSSYFINNRSPDQTCFSSTQS